MTAKRRFRDNTIKGWMIVILFLFLSLKSCLVNGQSTTSLRYSTDRQPPIDTVTDKTDNPLYLGYELALGTPIYTLKSDLGELNHLRVGNLGIIAGGVIANRFGKLRANVGMYYSDDNVPYSFDLFTGEIAANAYLLRIVHPKFHTVEPYFTGSISQHHIKFYGNYLDQGVIRNYSRSEEPFLGKSVTTQFNVGLGAEYQLENDDGDFIHLFIEVAYGIPFTTRCSREVFDRTHIINPFTINVGVSFGKIIPRGT